jgi:uncharacterized protein YlxP (DUF503 family)
MIIGVLTLELHLPESNVSIAEIDGNDLWQRCVLGAACVANGTKIVNQTLNGVRELVLSTPTVELIDSMMEML